jgi:CBS domain-containing protein
MRGETTCPAAPVGEIPAAVTASSAMTRPAVCVEPATSVAELVARMAASSRRAIPVVDGGFPVGIVTQSDLVARGGLVASLEALAAAVREEREGALEALARGGLSAAHLMTPEPVTIGEATTLREAAETMGRWQLKRLPVVDAQGRVSGVLSRVDVLRAVAGSRPAPADAPGMAGLDASAPLSAVMRRDPPAVAPGAPLDAVLRTVAATGLDRALVVDADRRPLGEISDAELLALLAPPLRRGVFARQVHGLAFGQAEREVAERHAAARTAAEIMVPLPSAPAELPLRDAIALVLSGAHKLLPVVDDAGRLIGAVDRADILRGLLLPAEGDQGSSRPRPACASPPR